MLLILLIVVALVAWALHLMQEAIQSREFSLMLAGFLVSSAAAAMMAVYFLMGHYVGYMTQTTAQFPLTGQMPESVGWVVPEDAWFDDWADSSPGQMGPLNRPSQRL